jgi:mycothiol synthase
VAALATAGWIDEITEDEIRRAWTAPGFDRELDARIAAAAGVPVGYADLEDRGGRHDWFWLFLVQRGTAGAAEALLAWGEERADVQAGDAARIYSGHWSEYAGVAEALAARGFRLARHSYRMMIELDADVSTPAVPDDVSVRCFRRGEERTVYDVHQETFEDVWGYVPLPYDEWEHWLLHSDRFDPELWFVAETAAGAETAGIALCSAHETEPGLGWISVLGVRRPWRRRGLGRRLLLHAFMEFRRRGFTRVGLGVDATSETGANRLYERAGMHVVDRFDTYEKPL